MEKYVPRYCTLFTTSLCNLNCSYCYICKDKDGNLQQIDNDIAKQFETNEQIKQILSYDPNLKENLEHIDLWGGEPMLYVERFIDKLEDWFETFPNIKVISTSTNFVVNNEPKKIKQLIDKVESLYHGKEKFRFEFQLSIDGYEEMNDSGRGLGVTKKFLENFEELCKITFDTKKIELFVHIKSTLSKQTFHFLDTEEKCYKWFKFFDEELFKRHKKHNACWSYANTLFNCAQPTEWTQEDGFKFAKIMQNIKNIQEKVKINLESWSSFETIIPVAFNSVRQIIDNPIMNLSDIGKRLDQKCCGGGCGAFIFNVIPLPHGTYCMCHRGVFDAYTEYAQNLQNKEYMNGLSEKYFKSDNSKEWLFNEDALHIARNMLLPLYTQPNQILYTDYLIFIREYAFAGIIDEKYKDIKNIQPVLDYFLATSYCLQDSYIFNGSWVTPTTTEIPLLFNGAMDIVENEIKEVMQKKGWSLE